MALACCSRLPVPEERLPWEKRGLSGPSQSSVEVRQCMSAEPRGPASHIDEGGRPWARPAFRCQCPALAQPEVTPPQALPVSTPAATCAQATGPTDPLQGAPGSSRTPGLRLLTGHPPLICVSQTSQQNFKKKKKKKATISCKLDIPVEAWIYFSGQRAQFPALRCMIKIN